MKTTRYIYTSALFFALGVNSLLAQDTPPKKIEEKTVTEEIEVVRPYKPVLAEAVKLRRSPDLDNLQTYKAKFNYSVTDRKLELNSDIQKLQAQKLADERQAALLNNYIKAGLGSLTTFLAEGYINTGRDEALQAGAFFRHFGQNGKIDGQDESRQQLTAFGKSILEKATLTGKLNYERHGLKFYGFDPSVNVSNPTLSKQHFNFIEGEGEIINKFTEASSFSYSTALSYSLIHSLIKS
ncbi:MAG: hypothetical protein EOP48_05895 [Sphingobacteriales bacterium]|nr:MAG: hypothetical protein EOP48_05895 [Sphingobacteriales bacterium]